MRVSVRGSRFGWPLVVAVAVLLAAAVALAAQPAGGATSADRGLASAQKKLRALYDGSLFTRPPRTGPKAQRGKSVWVIVPGLGTPSVTTWAKGARDAGKALGWKVKVFDGKNSPATWLEGVQQAVAAKADGIALIAVDCAPVKAGLQQARAAGIKVVAWQGADCNATNPGQRPLFHAENKYANASNIKQLVSSLDEAQADWVTVKTRGKGKVILVHLPDFVIIQWQTQAFKAELKRVCPGCKIVDQINVPVAELGGPQLRQRIEQSLLKHPDANAIAAPFDDIMGLGGSAAVRASGRSNKINVIAATGTAAALKDIRDNRGLDATIGLPFEYESWSGMDMLNRVFAGQKAANSGIGLQLVDREHMIKSTSGYVPPVDYKSAYRKVWKG